MYKINFETPIHVHFIGIGGISMSGLAEILLKEGFTISGSDNKESALTDHLEQMGAKVFYGQKASNIIPGIDVVVYTAAIHPDNEEYAEAVRQKLPMLTRAELLGQLMTNYDMPIAISGTHGKTTTSTMTAHLLHQSHVECTAFLGGISKNYGTNLLLSQTSPYTVIEADEFDRSFHWLSPYMTVITSTDPDHLDIYGTEQAYLESFEHYTTLIFLLCMVLVYLILCALYESVFIPFAVLLSVPCGLMGSFLFAWLFGLENNIYMQTGLIMIIGLLAKTAILLTEYAGKRRSEGMTLAQAAYSAAKVRLRPILMTVLSMVFGLVPLMMAHGVGANGSRSLATGVIGGMIVGTLALLFLVPSLFIVFQYIQERVKHN